MPDKLTKFMRRLDPKMQLRVNQFLEIIQRSPLGVNGVKKLRGCKNTYRVRMGKLRIVYSVHNKKVTLVDIDYRGNIY